MDVAQLNLVDPQNKQHPVYDLSLFTPTIGLALDRHGNVMITAAVGPSYVYWASFTQIDDKATNEAIFHYIAQNSFSDVAYLSAALKQSPFSYEETRDWYLTRLTQPQDGRTAWRTPFGHSYGLECPEYNGRYFAQDVADFLQRLQAKCRWRLADGNYGAVLDYYCSQILLEKDNPLYYQVLRPLDEIIRLDDYLVVAQDDTMRNKYLRVKQAMADRYGQYMSHVR